MMEEQKKQEKDFSAAPAAEAVAPQAMPQQMTLGVPIEQVRDHMDAAKRAAEAEARLKIAHEKNAAEAEEKNKAKAAKLAEENASRLRELENKNNQAITQLRRAKALSALPGLKDAESFLPLIDQMVEFDEAFNLTDESAEKLKAFKNEKPYLFDSVATEGHATTPAANAGHLPAEGNFTAEEQKTFQLLGIKPGEYKKTAVWENIGWIFGHDSRGGSN